MNPRILIAGIGNIFFGDDAFGVEVVRQLSEHRLPEQVQVMDFGIRSYDLAYALTEPYEAVILVDAVPRAKPPGTTFLLELAAAELPKAGLEAPDAHGLNPVSVLQLAQSFGGVQAKLFLVGCEPAALETDQIGLSAVVQAAVPRALELIDSLVSELLGANEKTLERLAPAGKEI